MGLTAIPFDLSAIEASYDPKNPPHLVQKNPIIIYKKLRPSSNLNKKSLL